MVMLTGSEETELVRLARRMQDCPPDGLSPADRDAVVRLARLAELAVEPAPVSAEAVYTVAEVSVQTRISAGMIRSRIHAGTLDAFKRNANWMIPESSVARLRREFLPAARPGCAADLRPEETVQGVRRPA